jgi:signal transduction histidine kinase
MPIWNKTVTGLITVRYYIALGLIALFVTVSFFILARAIDIQREQYRIVEVASKQRLSSQRIGFLVNALANVSDEELQQRYRRDLRRIIQDMTARHLILSLSHRPERIPSTMRSILQDIYYSGPVPFNDQVDSFLSSAQTLAETDSNDFRPGLPDLVRLNTYSVDTILQTHELIANLLEMESVKLVDRIRLLDVALWITILTLLVAEVPLIFQPMARRAANILDQMQAARLKAEREAAAAEAAREGQASFIRTMSHELRTPLNAILGMNQLSRMSGLSRKQAGYSEDIDSAGRHLLSLIDDILEFSRLEARQVAIHTVRTSLVEELERIKSMLQPLAAMACAFAKYFSI